jgi:hypothetical protein
MDPSAILLATLRFVCWEGALFAAAFAVARAIGFRDEEQWLGALAIEITLESSLAAAFSFARVNSPPLYWVAAAVCAAVALRWARLPKMSAAGRWMPATMAALAAPLILLAFHPVEEIDSINYLHYLIDWMGNRATPYTFATNYVAFWELSFLPAWTITRVDLFFPLLALKAVILLALCGWLIGRELGLRNPVLGWTIFGALAMRHYWVDYSGVPTLKNDALCGAGFALMILAVLRAARGRLGRADAALLAFGVAFGSAKYTGIFFAVLAMMAVLWLRSSGWKTLVAVGAFFTATSGHYYLRSLFQHGSPFYPFQINIGFIHLPGTADLSYSSILYNLHDPRLWRALFWPTNLMSPAGILFPETLAAILIVSAGLTLRWLFRWRRPKPLELASFLLLCGWVLYFRSVFSACAAPGDLSFVLNNLNSLRYVDGVLLASELLLVALLGRFALPLIAIQTASRLILLYARLPHNLFPAAFTVAVALASFLLIRLLPRHRAFVIGAILIAACPMLVQRNRSSWTVYWNDLKPSLQSTPGNQLAELCLEDGGYFAGHLVAAGNPVRPEVRAVLLPDLNAGSRPHFLAVMVTPGSEAATGWRARYGSKLTGFGYRVRVESRFGALFALE